MEYRIDDGNQTPKKNFDMFEGEIELVSEIHDDFRNNLDGLVCYLLLSGLYHLQINILHSNNRALIGFLIDYEKCLFFVINCSFCLIFTK